MTCIIQKIGIETYILRFTSSWNQLHYINSEIDIDGITRLMGNIVTLNFSSVIVRLCLL